MGLKRTRVFKLLQAQRAFKFTLPVFDMNGVKVSSKIARMCKVFITFITQKLSSVTFILVKSHVVGQFAFGHKLFVTLVTGVLGVGRVKF